MSLPPFNHSNIKTVYRTDWFTTEREIDELRNDYFYQSKPVPAGDIYGGLYLGIAKVDMQRYMDGEKIYRAIAICEPIMAKLRKANDLALQDFAEKLRQETP